MFDLTGKKIWVAGHNGMVGSAVVKRLTNEECEITTISRNDLDLTRQRQVENWLEQSRPDAIILAAAKVGGIEANNTYPADFLYQNLMIESNIIHAAAQTRVKKLLFLGSSCIYPKYAQQPMREDALLTGALEPTNQWYAIAKIAGIKLCQAYRQQKGCDFISAMPTNLYGPGDTYDLEKSHVIPALILKIHEAKLQGLSEVEIWGTGTPKREFLFVDDVADALIYLLKAYSGYEHVNVGMGQDLSIKQLAEKIAKTVGYKGAFKFNTDKPDGTPRKLLDINKISALGWQPQTSLDEGLKITYKAFLENQSRQQDRDVA